MPINIPNGLPAASVLAGEQIFVMTEERATHQDIRPLTLLFLNLMPKKIATEIQYMRKLSNTPLQVNIDLLRVDNHISKNTPQPHLDTFYKDFEEIENRNYDGMIITGAPLDQIDFSDVTYWDKLEKIIKWSKEHVTSTLFSCWGVAAGLKIFYDLPLMNRKEKLSGVFLHHTAHSLNPLIRGFDDEFLAPHSRFIDFPSDVIRAKTDKSFDVAMDQLSGHLSSKIKELRKSLTDVLVDITVNIDYPDEDIEEIMYSDMHNSLSQINDEVVKLISSAGTGRIINEGLKVAIIGRPNVGKSSLMNALLKEDRAIVTSIPGTTRDTIEEKISVRDIPVILTDTAGIRKTDDQIEKIGIEKSKASFNNADLIIFMVDASRTLDDEDMEIASYIGERKAILLINKTDLAREADTESLIKMMPQCKVIETSMTEERGIDELEDEIENLVYGGQIRQEESLIVSNARHLQLLRDASAALGDAMKMTEMEEALDFIEVDVKRAYDLLGEITGDSVADDIINEVFKRFCLGK